MGFGPFFVCMAGIESKISPTVVGMGYELVDVQASNGGRMLRVGEKGAEQQPIVLTEFGGIALRRPDDPTWGYSSSHTAEELIEIVHQYLKR